MTSTDHRPPLHAVHDDRTAGQHDRHRFAAFLTAKDLVLGYTRTATEGAARVAQRLRLDGLFTMLRRSYGWLLGAAAVAARGLRAPGVLAGLVWGLTTNGAVGKAVGWTLRLIGSPGARLATWLGSKLTAVKQAATDRVQQLQRLSGLLRSQNRQPRRSARSPGNVCYGPW